MPPDSSAFNSERISRLVRQVQVNSYEHALKLLYERINYEKIGHAPYTSNHYRLDRMRRLLELLGDPHHDYPIVHIAGTKGKGTTGTLLADSLRYCGHRTGLYTSPHLLKLEERIQFQGLSCTSADLVQLTAAALTAATQLEATGGGRATFFELTTAMGFLYFAQQAADCVVLEVGLGGRLDSTNVCRPMVSVITSISLDHQAQLGETIQEIAREKAGIIKPGVPVVCTARDPQARHVIGQVAAAQGSTLHLLERDFDSQWAAITPAETSSIPTRRAQLTYEGPTGCSVWTTRLLGRHQADNIAAALATLDALRELGWELPVESVQAAIAVAHPRARLEVVGASPIQIIDTAHNPASIQAGITALSDHFPSMRRTIVFASSHDKDYRQMLALLLENSEHLILTAYQDNPRALSGCKLFEAAQQLQAELDVANAAQLHFAPNPSEAWSLAQQLASPSEIILATGSFFLAAELLPQISPSITPTVHS
ncbi:MAG: Mur ligase family protein [Pirellulaceae bacterium]